MKKSPYRQPAPRRPQPPSAPPSEGGRVLRLAVGWPKTVLLMAMLFAALGAVFGANIVNDLKTGGFDDAGSESVRGTEVLGKRFTGADPNLVLIVEKRNGDVDDADATRVGRDVTARLRDTAGVSVIGSYWDNLAPELRSRKGDAGLVLARVAGDEDGTARRAAQLHDALAVSTGPVHIRFGGLAQLNNDMNEQAAADLAKADSIAIPVTLVLLLIVFGTVVAAGVPLIIGLFAIIGTLGVLAGLSSFTDVSIFALNLTTALGLGLAVDYSLLFVSRYREERDRLTGVAVAGPPQAAERRGGLYRGGRGSPGAGPTGRGDVRPVGLASIPAASTGGPAAPTGSEPADPRQLTRAALAATMRTAGRTVVFSAATVAAALCSLFVFSQYFLRSFAYAGVAVVALTVVGALVVLPALLMLLGGKIDRWALPGRRRSSAADVGVWGRVAAVVLRRPVLTAAPVVILLIALGAPFLHISFGVPDDRVLPTSVESRQVADRLRDDFPITPVGSLTVVAENWGSGAEADERTREYAADLSNVPGISRVDAATGSYAQGRRVAPPGPTAATDFRSGTATRLSMLSRVEPYSQAGGDLARAVRALPVPGGRDVLVTGQAAQLVDITTSIADRLPIALALIVVTSLVLLFLLTGSVLLPVKALLLNAVTLIAILGAMVLVFQDGHLSGLLGFTPTPIAVAIPVLLFCVTFGLSMDYEVFVLARISEQHEAGADLATAVTEGLSRSGRIISAAAAILSATFLAMLVSGVSLLKLFGLGAGLAILIDALLVRPILVPAFMRMAGRWNWWAPPPLRALHARFGISEGESVRPVRAGARRSDPPSGRSGGPARPPAADEPHGTALPLDYQAFDVILAVADRAPSAHNTQPWTVTSTFAQEIGWDDRSTLGPSDPTGRDHRLSLGAFVETCLILCTAQGRGAEFLPAYDAEQRRVGYLVGTPATYRTEFTAVDIRARHTWRGSWQTGGPDIDLLAQLHRVARLGGARLARVPCADARGLLVDASRWFFNDLEIVEELSAWSRLDPQHSRYLQDGLRDKALGLSAPEAAGLRAAIHPAVQHIGHRVGLPAMLAGMQGKAFDGDGSVLVLLGPSTIEPAAEIELGRTMLRIWLELTRHGFAAHPQSHLIDCPDTGDRLADLVGAADERVLWVARVGRPQVDTARTFPISARRLRRNASAQAS
jgi:RND superfamily putative drug exporter